VDKPRLVLFEHIPCNFLSDMLKMELFLMIYSANGYFFKCYFVPVWKTQCVTYYYVYFLVTSQLDLILDDVVAVVDWLTHVLHKSVCSYWRVQGADRGVEDVRETKPIHQPQDEKRNEIGTINVISHDYALSNDNYIII